MASFNATDFGAVANDDKDDTLAINLALEAAHAEYLKTGVQASVILPTGTLIVSGTGDKSEGAVRMLTGTTLQGAGAGQTILKVADGWRGDITGVVRTPFDEVTTNVGLFNLTIDGNRANTLGKIDGFYTGVRPGSTQQDANIHVSGVEIKNSSGYGFDPHEQTINLTIENSSAHGNGLDGFVADFIVNGTYRNNVAYNNDRHGFNVTTSTTNLLLEGNKAYNNGLGATGGAGIVVQRGSEDIPWPNNIRIVGGEYYGNAKEGILLNMASGVTVDRATIYGNKQYGIRIEGSDDTIVRDSRIFNNAQAADNTYDEISIRPRDDAKVTGQVYYSNNTQILNNTIYSDGAINARYGIREESSNTKGGATGTQVSGNNISGMDTGLIFIPGQAQAPAGTAGNDTFEGVSGGQEMRGLGGDDTYTVNHSQDVVIEAAGEGNDTVLASINHTLAANVENLTLTGTTAVRATGNELNNRLTGNALGNELEGKDGNDILDGGAGADTMVGGNGNDTYFVDDAADIIIEKFTSGAGGIDEVFSSVSYVLSDEIEKLTLTGTANLNVTGNSDANILIGNAGSNILSGRAGNDILDGQGGSDTAWYDSVRVTYTVSGNLQNRTVKSASEGTDSLASMEVLQFVDGRVVYDVSDAAAVAYRLYDSAFNRAPDSLGFNYQIGALQSGVSLSAIASNFAASPEFQATYGALSNRGFVEQLYRNVLNREGDAGGINYHVGQLDAGTATRGQVLANFSESPEHIELLRPAVEAGLWDQDEAAVSVARLYYATLDRAPDAGGLVYQKNALASGLALHDVADGFVFSSEFQARYGNLQNQQFVEQLYLNVLDRAGDAGGIAFYTERLNSGQWDRGQVVVGFSESPEHQVKTQAFFDNGILIA